MPVRSRDAAVATGVALLGATLAPVLRNWRHGARDSFPLSHYPMFTAERPDLLAVTHLVGVDRDGGRRVLPYTLYAGGGLNQVRRQLDHAVDVGAGQAVCRRVSRRLVARAPRWADVTEVRLVTAVYPIHDPGGGQRTAVDEVVHAWLRVDHAASRAGGVRR